MCLPYSSTLCLNKHVVTIGLFHVWDSLGEITFNKTDLAQVEGVLCWEEIEESMGNCPFMIILDILESKIKGF